MELKTGKQFTQSQSRHNVSYQDSTGKFKTSHSGNMSALAAVAFQDHLTRNLNLSLSNPFPSKKVTRRGPQRQVKSVKAVVDTGRESTKTKKKVQKKEAEYVLDPEPKPLSLGFFFSAAQKLGLVEAPQQPLSDKEWSNVKEKSNRREDSALPCVICKEDFGLQPQVLLSCSHVFHRNCLGAFECFTGKKTCPMCRKEEYQTRVIYEGARVCRIQSAVRIQAAWRGYVVRSWYKKLRETVPPKEPILRKKYYEEKLSNITERLIRSCDPGVDDFLREVDQSMKASRNIFMSLESSKLRTISEEEWESIHQKAKTRGTSECPICIMPFRTASSSDSPRQDHSNRKYYCLLSCTHLFHKACLEAFEEFSLLEEKVCPVCRSSYHKRYL
ncbi:RING finger protein 32 [Holothuria leucospilota]|uniref:RING finger protein 32 n=1 Tax=Holothuria leucospilota TaxID=206669 RepID=A0A9Q1C0Y9_HOLLE|nr:RING finger protein 32 [Holothuria leucospilota]